MAFSSPQAPKSTDLSFSTGLSLRGFVQRSLPSSSQRARRRGFQRCLGMRGWGHCGASSQWHLCVASCPSSSPLPTPVSPVVDWVSAALGRGFSRRGAPSQCLPRFHPGCCSLAIARSRGKAPTWCWGSMLANVSPTGTLVSIARPSPCSAGGIRQGIASDFIFNQLLVRITAAYAGPYLSLSATVCQ